jgi:hypothetical protein
MLGSNLGKLAALWLIGQWSKSGGGFGGAAAGKFPTSSTTWPRDARDYPYARDLPLPPTQVFSTEYKLNAPTAPDANDQRWLRYVVEPSRPGPRAKADDAPINRGLSDFEHWALAPYFIRQDLDNVSLFNGVEPPGLPQGFASKLPATMWALTFVAPGGPALVWLPHFHALMYERWWLGLLAHEITHGAQGRMGGLSPQQAVEQYKSMGYEKMPTEVQARWMQDAVLQGLDRRAMAFSKVVPA